MSEPMNAAPAREPPQQEDLSGPPAANRHRLPDERVGLTHHFSIAGHEGYLTVGLYPNGQPCEIFIRQVNHGLPLSLDGIAIPVRQAATAVCTTNASRRTTRQRRGKPGSRCHFAISPRQL